MSEAIKFRYYGECYDTDDKIWAWVTNSQSQRWWFMKKKKYKNMRYKWGRKNKSFRALRKLLDSQEGIR